MRWLGTLLSTGAISALRSSTQWTAKHRATSTITMPTCAVPKSGLCCAAASETFTTNYSKRGANELRQQMVHPSRHLSIADVADQFGYLHCRERPAARDSARRVGGRGSRARKPGLRAARKSKRGGPG